MSFSAARLTCYALLSALEEDLRSEIEAVASAAEVSNLLGPERAEKVQQRRARDQGSRPTDSLAALLPYLDFADAFDILLKYTNELPSTLVDQLDSLKPRFQRLGAVRNRVAHSRPMEIDDLPNVLDATGILVGAQGNHWPHLTSTTERLASDPSHVLALTVDLVADVDAAPQNNLPVPDFDETGFFGRRAQVDRIKKAVKGAYPVISILGDGGIGKTSLALKVAYELLDDPKQQFDAFVWVTAKATVLTVNEIRRISDAVQDSLGLFAMAAKELGGEQAAATDPTVELLSYLETFKVLLFLDNMETVLDQRLRDFLLDLPLGSKVVITSRIGLGIENPVQLAPLTKDESANLLRAVARIRQVDYIKTLPQEKILELAEAMGGHPAYIKWFVSGIQAGRRPEELLSDNALLLDFCMSNVFQYLDEEARAVLRSMQALPGPKTQAELAFINDCNAKQIQGALLELMTTNFVQMQSLSPSQLLETTYQLSDFGKQYLDKAHAVAADEQAWLIDRRRQLTELGDTLREENSASPFDPRTIDVRGSGDFHVAKLLRDAIRSTEFDSDIAITLCREAQVLAPTYHETWRVEAYLQDARGDYTSASTAYERAAELAPSSQPLNYFYGAFLVRHGVSPAQGLRYLQKAVDVEDPEVVVLSEIASTHVSLGDWGAAIATAAHAIEVGRLQPRETSNVILTGLRAAVLGSGMYIDSSAFSAGLELVEESMPLCEAATTEYPADLAFDRMLQLKELCSTIASVSPEDFVARKAANYEVQLQKLVERRDPLRGVRRLGSIKTLVTDKYYGFIRLGHRDYFFHGRDLAHQDEWHNLAEGRTVAFRPIDNHPRGPRAGEPALLD
ncbi:NB-ARC domain-containing protein [Serinicoccus sp. LYQ131]|uniref:NB-ARC domain-containing protein n=1 Tax=Serinicoccus sp. LYQ131 TaxID=3378797 RepID=UPI003853764A